MRLRQLPLLALLAFALLAPTASASPAAAPTHAANAAKAKKCKRKSGESKKHWLKRCKCKAFKTGETRKKFKQRCPGAKVPKRKAPSGGGTAPTVPTPPAGGPTPPASGPLTGQAAIDYVNAAIKGMKISRQSCSGNGCERSLTEFVDFCSDGGTFNGRTTNDNSVGGVYESVYSGTYKVLEAQVNTERTGAQARVNLTLTQASGNDDPPQSGDRLMTLVGSNLVYMGETEYTRGTAGC